MCWKCGGIIHYHLTANLSAGERILKISQHVVKLQAGVWCTYTFWYAWQVIIWWTSE